MAAVLRLHRPADAALALVGVALGAALAAGRDALDAPLPLALTLASAVLVGAGAQARRAAGDARAPRWPGPALSALGVAVGAAASAQVGGLALGAVALLWGAQRRRATPWLGVAAAALVAGGALLAGARAVGGPGPAVWQGVALAVALGLIRETVALAEARAAEDRAPLAAPGARRAAGAALGLLAATLAALPLPAVLGLGRSFALGALPCAVCLLAAAWGLGLGLGLPAAALRARARLARAWLGGAMATGAAALALARLL